MAIPHKMIRVSLIFGTRPEAIKLCPLVHAMRSAPDFEPHVCVTGQHRQMLDQVLEAMEVRPDVDLGLMRADQTLASLTARAITACDEYLAEAKPDLVLVQGDTTTVFCAALAAFYHRIPVGHVEAGLRTRNKYSPFPEEINRTLATHLSDLHFAPTHQAKQNLVREGIAEDSIFVTGNTVIDALQFAVAKVKAHPPEIPGLPPHVLGGRANSPLVLITGHRRESFGQGFENICCAIAELAAKYPDVNFVYPVHLNPKVREPVYRILQNVAGGEPGAKPGRVACGGSTALPGVDRRPGHSTDNIHLIEPLGYLPFVWLMSKAHVILTDSGGVQEEAPSLGKPVLVMRDTTERPEAVEMGAVRLVGAHRSRIVEGVSRLLTDESDYASMAQAVNPYGDGQACERIIAAVRSVRGQLADRDGLGQRIAQRP